jgi:hypothetical protein
MTDSLSCRVNNVAEMDARTLASSMARLNIFWDVRGSNLFEHRLSPLRSLLVSLVPMGARGGIVVKAPRYRPKVAGSRLDEGNDFCQLT